MKEKINLLMVYGGPLTIKNLPLIINYLPFGLLRVVEFEMVFLNINRFINGETLRRTKVCLGSTGIIVFFVLLLWFNFFLINLTLDSHE